MSRRDRQRAEPPATPREPVSAAAHPPANTYDPSKDLSPRKIPAAVPSGAVWNGIRRAWLVPGPDGALVVADPQPPPPERSFTTGKPVADVLPAVKISA